MVPRTLYLLVNAIVFQKGTKPPQPLHIELNVQWQLINTMNDMAGSYLKCFMREA